MQQILIKYISAELVGEILNHEIDIHDDLLGSGLVDSLGMMKLILFIETEFEIKVPPEDMIIENFMTVSHICNYLEDNLLS